MPPIETEKKLDEKESWVTALKFRSPERYTTNIEKYKALGGY